MINDDIAAALETDNTFTDFVNVFTNGEVRKNFFLSLIQLDDRHKFWRDVCQQIANPAVSFTIIKKNSCDIRRKIVANDANDKIHVAVQ